ncbi:Uncharacterised protein [Legionella busanensis]|uniref:Leucine-rich repeat domain-containing protein n=1 Tax=Legionella busanensis TaxID=190655 RepID=A0A378JN62_9GAMM|nr:leucine-rich repeat domain-containing protein [Legionella busanensis]STX52161.1 Uncharacterised protein [Legionella busanensis]
MQLNIDSKTFLRVTKDNITSDGVFHLPAGITLIGESAFENCIDLRKLVIPNGVTSIGNWAFYGCNNLHTLEIPVSIRSIGKDVFAGCITLEYIIIASNNSADFDRITALLPEWFRNKVTTQDLFNKVTCFRDKQLARLTRTPQTNPLYRFFNSEAKFVSKTTVETEEKRLIEKICSKLPDDIFWHINEMLKDDNCYYHKAEVLIGLLPYPKSESEFRTYQKEVEEIVNQYIDKAIVGVNPVSPSI